MSAEPRPTNQRPERLSYISPWASLYTRIEQPLAETVRDYDRAWVRLRQEVGEVRGSLLQTQEKLAGLEAERGFEERSQLQAEVDRREEEILRLRDLLIGRDVELGGARGELAVLEANSRRVAGVALKIQSRIPGGMRIGGALRRLLGRRG